MRSCFIRIEVPEGEVKQILDELNKAQEKIYECYNRLEGLGVVTVIKKDAAENGDAKSEELSKALEQKLEHLSDLDYV
ncbi:MAG: hypothetical protein IJS96_08880 [Schwartzia sp.]|nr:hypothetical protein [Schwartzia sp. (in: firmicutes)]